jgi:hypothetical protein
VDTGHQFRPLEISIVVIQEHPTSFFIESRFGIRDDKKTFDDGQDVADSIGRLPIPLESVYANISRCGDIRVKYLGRKIACRCRLKEEFTKKKRGERGDGSGMDTRYEHLGGAAGNSLLNVNLTLK